MERNERVRHVYVHAGGKVEALGTKASNDANPAAGPMPMVTVETVCVVDVRENIPSGKGEDNAAPTASKSTVMASDSPSKQPSGKTPSWRESPVRASKLLADEEKRTRQREEARVKEEKDKLKKLEEGWDDRIGGSEKRKGDLPSLRATSAPSRSSTAEGRISSSPLLSPVRPKPKK